MKGRESIRNVYKAAVVGASAGGMTAIGKLLHLLPERFSPAVIVVQHLMSSEKGYLAGYLNDRCTLPVKEVEDKEKCRPGHVYLAPANYHLLIEKDETFSLSIDTLVNYSRPSIDVVFESAARVWFSRLIGIILTGANHDGTEGMKYIRDFGGFTIAQDPSTAESPVMPRSAIEAGVIERVMSVEKIGEFLMRLQG